jgi:hypothetical protein
MKTYRAIALPGLLALVAALWPASALGNNPSAGAARPARVAATPSTPRAPTAFQRDKARLLARGKGYVRGSRAKWMPATRLARIKPHGGIRIRSFKKARLISVYVPETRNGVAGFRIERLYGMAAGAAPAGSTGAIVDKVESSYAAAIEAMIGRHITKPEAAALGDLAIRDLEQVEDASDPVEVGRRGIAATTAGRDPWTRYLAPAQHQQRQGRYGQAPTNSVTTRRTRDGVAVVRLTGFTKDIASQIAGDLGAQRPRGVVLDLRGNGGGSVFEARRLIELFATDTRLVTIDSTRDGGRETEERWHPPGPGAMAGVPLVIMVDARTASASEIVAASLRDAGLARVVGKKTYGKGVKQGLTELDDGGSVWVTMGELQTPTRRWHGVGIDPDIDESDLLTRGRRALNAGRDHAIAGGYDTRAPTGDAVLVGAIEELRTMIPGGR